MSVQGEYELAARFRKLVESVAQSRRKNDADSFAFAYLLTPKQADEIDRVCDENRWERVNCYAIMIKPGYIRHVLAARKDKDGLSVAEIAAVVAKAYSPRSLLRINPPSGETSNDRRRDRQSVILNTQQKVLLRGTPYYATAILEIRIEGCRRYLAPVTCYHATEAKKRRILK
jgi:hypothetical protein